MRQTAWEDLFKAAETPPREDRPAWWTRLAILSWEEWVTLAVVLIVFTTVVQSLDSADWVQEMPSLYPVAFLGLAVGLALAKTRLHEAFAHLFALAVGAASVVVSSTSEMDGSLALRTSELSERVSAWLGAFASGGISTDNLPFVVMIVSLTYLTAYISAWSIFRWYNAWGGLIPGGLALLTNISYLPGQASFPLVVYLFGAIVLVARIHVLRNAREWRQTRTAYPDILSLHVLNVTIWVAVLLLGLAWIMPVGGGGGVMRSFWNAVTAPVAEPLSDLQRLFSAIDSKRGGMVHKFGSTLPLQGEIKLGGGEVMSVIATEPGFLRAQTYDTYTAQGWKISSANQITSGTWPALKALQSPDEARREFRRPVSIQVTTSGRTNVIFSAGLPLAVSIDTRIVFGPDASDVTSVRPPGKLAKGSEYKVDGTVSAASPGRLRSAGTSYPAWTAAYLQLPRDLPARVKEKAIDVASGADNPYDRANLIEQFLRTYAIDTGIPPAPANEDSVAYFLFDAQRGYFDYHASAMVVMLRALGIPSRIAVGYVVRPLDRIPNSNTYVVTEANSFAWPEVYFPGLGWVEFNPTPSEPRISRPGSDDQAFSGDDLDLLPEGIPAPDEDLPPVDPAEGPLDQLSLDEGSTLVGNIILGLVLGSLALTIVGGGLFQFSWQRGLAGLDYPSQVWEKTQRLSRWARIRPTPQQTPTEYAVDLQREMPDVEDVAFLGEVYVRSRYGKKELKPEEKERLTAVWRAVRNHLLGRILRWR